MTHIKKVYRPGCKIWQGSAGLDPGWGWHYSALKTQVCLVIFSSFELLRDDNKEDSPRMVHAWTTNGWTELKPVARGKAGNMV